MTNLLLSANSKSDNYNSILVIVNRLTKIVYYKLVKLTINTLKLAKVIINMIVQYYNFANSIIGDRGAIFTFEFWFLLYYFFTIKR